MGMDRRGRARRVIDLQGNQRLARDVGMAAPKFFVTVCASPSWADEKPAIERARAAQVAAMMVRIFMGLLLLRH